VNSFFDDTELTERRFYKIVSANSVERDDYTPASGVKVTIMDIGGNADPKNATTVSIILDRLGTPNILLNTYGDSLQDITDVVFIGDGTKKITIELRNNTENDAVLGGFWRGLVR